MDENVRDEGNDSFKHIIRITYPVILSMFSLNLMVMVDRAFVAKYSLAQFSATLPASSMATAIASIFIGITGFVSSLVAQYYGAGKYKDCASSMWQGVYVSIIFSMLLLIVSPVASSIFNMMGHTGELLKYEKQFFFLIMLSSCVQLFSTAFSSFYRGIGDTKTTLYVGVVVNICNFLFDWILIFGKLGLPRLGGILGSGLSTIISCSIGVLAYILLLNREILKNKYNVFKNRQLDRLLIYKLLKFGFPAGIQSFVGTGYFSLLLLIIGKTGEFNLSCANIAFTIEGISIFPIWGLGAAISIIVGQERGSEKIENIPKVVKKGVLLGLCFNLVIIVVFNFFPDFLISIFNSGDEKEKFSMIKDYTIPLVRLTSVWIVFDTIQIIAGNALRTVGDTLFMMVTYMTMPFLFYAVLPYIICVVVKLPMIWLWVELVIFTLCMLIVISKRFSGGKWKQIKVI